MDHDNASLFDISDNFTISATKSITVYSPNLGNVYWVDKTGYVQWEITGPIYNVDIALYKGGALNRTILSNFTMPTTGYWGTYNWRVPVDLVTGTNYNIRVADHANASVFDLSETFTINATKTIRISAPMYPVREKDNVVIQWTYTGYIPFVDISLWMGGSLCAQLILNLENTIHYNYGYMPSDYGNYLWKVWEGLTPATTYQFRVSDHSNASLFSMSTQFSINNTKTIMVNVPSPVGVSQAAPVQWLALGGIAAVDVSLYWNASLLFPIWSDVATPTIPMNQRYWIVPSNLTSGQNYTIRVSEHGNPAVFGTSNNFTINATRTLKLNSPTNMTIWYVGDTYDVLWQSTGAIPRVNITLYMGGAPLVTIANNVTNNGRYTWTVPGSVTETIQNYRVRVVDASNGSLYAFSAFFLIDTTKAIQSVSASSQVVAGSTLFVNWASIGDIPAVDIVLYQGITENMTLASGKTNDGFFSWLVPTSIALGAGYYIRVRSSSNSSIYAQSGSIQVLAFNPAVNSYDVTVGDVLTWSVSFNLTMAFPDAFWTALDDLAMNMGGVLLDSKQMYQNFIDTVPDAWILQATIKSIVSTGGSPIVEQIIADLAIKEAGQPAFLPFGVYLQSFLTELKGALGILGQAMFPGGIQIPADIGNNIPIGNCLESEPGVPISFFSMPSPILPMNSSWLDAYDYVHDSIVNGTDFAETWGTWENYTSTYGFDLNATAQGWDFAWDLLQFNDAGPQFSGIGGVIDMYIAQFNMMGLNLSVLSLPATGSFRYTDDMVFESLNATASVRGNFTALTGQQSPYSLDISLSAALLSHDRVNLDPVISTPADDAFYAGTSGNNITWTITDKTVGTTTYTVYRNGTNFGSPGSWTSGSAIVINVNTLPVGTHNITIVAEDGLGGISQDEVIVTVSSDIAAPSITNPFVDPTRVFNQHVTVRCDVTDGLSGVGTVELWYAVNSNSSFTQCTMTVLAGDTYTYDIPAQAFGSIVYYYYKATDRSGNAAVLNNSYTYTLDQLIGGSYTITFTTPVALTITIVVDTPGKLELETYNATSDTAGLNITSVLTSFNLSFTGSFSLVTFRYTYTGTVNADLIRVFHWDGATWEHIAPVVNPTAHTVTFTMTSLSPFIVGVIVDTGSPGFDFVQFIKDYWIILVIAGGVVVGVAVVATARRKKVSKVSPPSKKKSRKQLAGYSDMPSPGTSSTSPARSNQPAGQQLEWAQPAPVVGQGGIEQPAISSQPDLVIGDEINLYCPACQAWSTTPAVKRVNGQETCQQCGAPYYVVTKCTKCESDAIIPVSQFNEFRANPSRCTKCQGIFKVL
jgi:hypothetical protein